MQYKVSVYEESLQGLNKDELKRMTKKISALISQGKYTVPLPKLAAAIEAQFVWCPATFTGTVKRQDDLESIQLFALDFDGGIDLDTALSRAKQYKIPAALYYETKSSVNYSKFRMVFACIQEIHDRDLAVLVQHCLFTVFVSHDCRVKLYSNFPLKQCVIVKNRNHEHELGT